MSEYANYEQGELLRDRYLKLNDISEGSYGIVTLAKDVSNGNRLVAVKYIFPLDQNLSSLKKSNFMSSEEDIDSSISSGVRDEKILMKQQKLNEEAMKEIEIHNLLGVHQNIASLYDYFDSYIILEYCSRGDLYEAIKSNQGPSHANDLIDVMSQLMDAIEFCHSNSVYHRDIKPENILISEDWSIKLTDWGLSSTKRICTDFDIGSERYMAPELFDHSNITSYDAEKVDLWSFGIVLLNLIFHKNPFQVANSNDKLFVHFASNREILFDIFPTMSFDLFGVLRFCLTIDPDNRNLTSLRNELLKVEQFTIEDDLKYYEEEQNMQEESSSDKETTASEHSNDKVESITPNSDLGSTSLQPIPITSSDKFIRNTRKPFGLPSYHNNANGHQSSSYSTHANNYNRQDFFTPKSVFNHYMDKIDKNRGDNTTGNNNANIYDKNYNKNGKRRPWKRFNKTNNYTGTNIKNSGSKASVPKTSYSYSNRNSYQSKQPPPKPAAGKYVPPFLRSPSYQKSPVVEPLHEDLDKLDLNDDYDDLFVLEDNDSNFALESEDYLSTSPFKASIPSLVLPSTLDKKGHDEFKKPFPRSDFGGLNNRSRSRSINHVSKTYARSRSRSHSRNRDGMIISGSLFTHHHSNSSGHTSHPISGNGYSNGYKAHGQSLSNSMGLNGSHGSNGSNHSHNGSHGTDYKKLSVKSQTRPIKFETTKSKLSEVQSTDSKNLPSTKNGKYIPPNRRGSFSVSRPISTNSNNLQGVSFNRRSLLSEPVTSSSVPTSKTNWFKFNRKSWDDHEDEVDGYKKEQYLKEFLESSNDTENPNYSNKFATAESITSTG